MGLCQIAKMSATLIKQILWGSFNEINYRLALKRVVRIERNEWSRSAGMGGQSRAELVVRVVRNTHIVSPFVMYRATLCAVFIYLCVKKYQIGSVRNFYKKVDFSHTIGYTYNAGYR